MRRRVLGASVALLGVALIDTAVATWAQSSGRHLAAREGYRFEDYSLTLHVLAMAALAIFAVGIAAALWWCAAWPLAVLVVLGTAGGPMCVTAAPALPSLVHGFADTAVWWHATVQTPQAVLLLMAAFLLAGARPSRTAAAPKGAPSLPTPLPGGPSDAAWFTVVAATALAAQVVARSGADHQPAVAPMLGWALLGAGVAVTARRPSPALGPGALLAGSTIVWLTLNLAYDRRGGWPGAAGWETFAQSPVVLSWMVAAVLLVPPAAVLVKRAHRRGPSLTTPRQRVC